LLCNKQVNVIYDNTYEKAWNGLQPHHYIWRNQ
jgi:hypothetical protein